MASPKSQHSNSARDPLLSPTHSKSNPSIPPINAQLSAYFSSHQNLSPPNTCNTHSNHETLHNHSTLNPQAQMHSEAHPTNIHTSNLNYQAQNQSQSIKPQKAQTCHISLQVQNQSQTNNSSNTGPKPTSKSAHFHADILGMAKSESGCGFSHSGSGPGRIFSVPDPKINP